MAVKSNKIIPVVAVVALAIVGTILFQQFSGPRKVKPGEPMAEVPSALPKTQKGADADTPNETLRQVTASNNLLREKIERVIKDNDELKDQNAKLARSRNPFADGRNGTNPATGQAPAAAAGAAGSSPAAASAGAPVERSTADVFSGALDTAGNAASGLINNSPFRSKDAAARGNADSGAQETSGSAEVPAGTVRYKLVPPMGYVVQTTARAGGANGTGASTTRFVRTTESSTTAPTAPGTLGPAGRAAQQASIGPGKPESVPYFTIPENATLAGVTAMSSIIGRVPIDGRVTDPMQFKAIVGRDNLAANGFELPDDIAGMIVTGVAIGDMALSCSEGKVRSMTFVFNDGSIRTVSTRRSRGQGGAGNAANGGIGNGDDLGFISDEHGNPCIPGKFVTNAASYLTDIISAKSLGVAAKAYSEAERTVSTNGYGGFTSAVTGNQNRFALGAAASGATDELTTWLLSRLKNSFDAVVTPSGQKLVVHLDQEIQLDKAANARKLVYRTQGGPQLARGARYGLE